MTEEVVIRAEKLGKKYLIGHQAREWNPTLRDAITRSARQWGRAVRDIAKGAANVAGDEVEEFWALKDVNFAISRGDVVGVIGRNGAGKSTLLKVLSRITEPSEGRVEIRGRVASLLEVGTGFHPELSGRENIFLNGAILGMSRNEITRKFDEIVAFAEIEKFLDTPVKRYSSGMYVRLAFAVAAHLEPEILIVDEVLAVGDAEFQKKCLGKMQDVAGHGRTVLFVSHNISSIRRLCTSIIYLQSGSVAAHSRSSLAALDRYASSGSSVSKWTNAGKEHAGECFRPIALEATIRDQTCIVRVSGEVLKPRPGLQIAIGLYSSDGDLLMVTSDRDVIAAPYPSGEITLEGAIDLKDVNAGLLRLNLAAYIHNEQVLIDMNSGPSVVVDFEKVFSHPPLWTTRRPGFLAPVINWQRQAGARSDDVVPDREREPGRAT